MRAVWYSITRQRRFNMPDLDFNFKYALYGLISFFLVSVGGNAWTIYKLNTMQTTIDEQLNGKLGLKASILATLDDRLGTGNSKMVVEKN